MKNFFRKIPRPSLTTVIILLTAAILLACGPATQATPGEQPSSQPAPEKSTPEPTNTPEPTPPPTDIVTINPDGSTNEIVQWVPEKSPPTYPGMDSILEHLVKELKEAEDGTASGSGPREQQQTVEDAVVAIVVRLTANTLTVDEWVRSKGFTTANVREFEDGSGGRFSTSVPLSLLAELAAQEGVSEIDSITHKPSYIDKE